MRKLIEKIRSKATKTYIHARETVSNNRGEGYIDTGIKIIIGVVIGGVILAGLYTLFNTTVIPTMTSKISGMFNYTGA